jgi:hypothetical protein
MIECDQFRINFYEGFTFLLVEKSWGELATPDLLQVPGTNAAARGGVCPPAGLPLEDPLQGLQTGEQLTSLWRGGCRWGGDQ